MVSNDMGNRVRNGHVLRSYCRRQVDPVWFRGVNAEFTGKDGRHTQVIHRTAEGDGESNCLEGLYLRKPHRTWKYYRIK